MSSRRKVNGESPSSSEEGGFLTRWRNRRREKKMWVALYVALEEHLDAGLPVEDFFLFSVEEEVQWDKDLQCWLVRVTSLGEIELEPGYKVNLERGRGGAEETARIKEVLGEFVDVKSGISGFIYILDFGA